MDWYDPGEDSYTFYDTLEQENLKNKIIVDLGCSTGIISELLRKNNLVLSVDLNLKALKEYNRTNPDTNLINSDLLMGLNQNKIDILVFNPPYVPDFECPILGGGEHGRDIINNFVANIEVLCFYLLIIEANKPLEIIENIKDRGYTVTVIKIRKVIGETIIILKASK